MLFLHLSRPKEDVVFLQGYVVVRSLVSAMCQQHHCLATGLFTIRPKPSRLSNIHQTSSI